MFLVWQVIFCWLKLSELSGDYKNFCPFVLCRFFYLYYILLFLKISGKK